tara:strand:- start:7008 stop:7307 length:300 start_codon:yes stop_codon:yes gene_type:complete
MPKKSFSASYKQETINKAHYMKQLGESHSTIGKKLGLTKNQLSYILYQKEPSPKENIVARAPAPKREKELEAMYQQTQEAVSFANKVIRRVKKILGMKA